MRINIKSPSVQEAVKYYYRGKFLNEIIFKEDYTNFFTVKKFIKNFITKQQPTDCRKILNKVITLTNTFEVKFVIRKLVSILTLDELSVLKSTLRFLEYRMTDDLLSHVDFDNEFHEMLTNMQYEN